TLPTSETEIGEAMRRALSVIVLASALVLSAAGVATPATAVAPRATSEADATATGKTLVNKFFTLVQKKDTAGLKQFLSSAFELQRADGSGANKSEYLDNLSTVQSFTLSQIRASRSASVLVVRYLAEATGIVNSKPYDPGPAPRLTVFSRNGDRWQVV